MGGHSYLAAAFPLSPSQRVSVYYLGHHIFTAWGSKMRAGAQGLRWHSADLTIVRSTWGSKVRARAQGLDGIVSTWQL